MDIVCVGDKNDDDLVYVYFILYVYYYIYIVVKINYIVIIF